MGTWPKRLGMERADRLGEIDVGHRSQNWTAGGWGQRLAPGKQEGPQKAQLVQRPGAWWAVSLAEVGQRG